MTESRWQRWSRKKTEARKEPAAAPPPLPESEPTPAEQELAINESLPEQEVLAKYDLPDPDAIQKGTDITGFMRKEIPELLRRKALRSLWKSNPVLAVLDGLNDYDEDFTDAAPGVKGTKTLYQVGKGLLDKTSSHQQEPLEQNTMRETASASVPEEAAADDGPEPVPMEHRETHPPEQTGPQVADADPEPMPRYRPRMRFD